MRYFTSRVAARVAGAVLVGWLAAWGVMGPASAETVDDGDEVDQLDNGDEDGDDGTPESPNDSESGDSTEPDDSEDSDADGDGDDLETLDNGNGDDEPSEVTLSDESLDELGALIARSTAVTAVGFIVMIVAAYSLVIQGVFRR